jgi:hypothetical protein
MNIHESLRQTKIKRSSNSIGPRKSEPKIVTRFLLFHQELGNFMRLTGGMRN